MMVEFASGSIEKVSSNVYVEIEYEK